MPRLDANMQIKNLDHRVANIEQILPTLATKDDLQNTVNAAVAPLATRKEMHAAIQAATAPLATREEMHAAINAAVAPLATREEMRTAIRTEGEETRRHFDVVAEALRVEIRVIAEGYVHVNQRIDQVEGKLERDVTLLDQRVMRLEAKRSR